MVPSMPIRFAARLLALLLVPLLAVGGCQPTREDPAALRLKAEAQVRDGRLGAAVVTLQRALELAPDDPTLLQALARTLVRHRRIPEAIDAYCRLLELSPTNAIVAAELAALYYQGGLHEKSLAVADRLLALDPNSALGHTIRGGSLFAIHGPTAEVKRELAVATTLDPTLPAIHINVAAVAMAEGNGDEAIRHLKEAVRLAPDDLLTRVRLAETLIEVGRPREAASEARAVLDRNSKVPRALTILARAALAAGRASAAVEAAQSLARYRPQSLEAQLLLGRALHAAAIDQQAISAFNEAAKLSPKDPDIVLRRAGSKIALGWYDDARKDLALARQLGAAPAAAANLEGVIDALTGRPEAAHAAFTRAIETTAGFVPAYENLGHLANLAGDRATALAWYRKAHAAGGGTRIRLDRWRTLLAGQRPEQVIGECETILESHPDAEEVLLILLEAYRKQGDRAAVAATVKRLLAAAPDSPEAHIARGHAALDADDLVAAEAAYREALRLAPTNVDALRAVATLEIASARLNAAADHLRQAVDHDPQELTLRLLLGRVENNRGNPAAAASLALTLLDERGDLPDAFEILGVARAREGRWVEAADAFHRLTTVAPNRPLGFWSLARALVEMGQLDRAEAALATAARLAPDSPEVVAIRARLRLAQGRIKEATADCDTALAALPDRLSLLLLRALLLDAGGDQAAARAAFEAAVARFPRAVEARLAFAHFYDRAGNAEQAMARFREAIDLHPTADALLRLAELTDATGNPREAERLFEKAASMWPGDPVVINGLAYFYADHRIKLALGLEKIRKALERRPHDGHLLDTRGWLEYQLRRPLAAVATLEEARQRLPHDPFVAYHLGLAYYQVGRLSEAVEALNAVVATDDFPEADAAQEVLAKLR